ncbi:MAG: FAD-dependent oxidoreductase [Candidatus Pacearchaeota archaeon]
MRHNILEGKHDSIWVENLKKKKYLELKKNISVDVVVVGGGLAGINCAYLLKKRGYSVAVIEKGRMGMGVTSKTTAKITYAHGLIYSYLIKKFGFKKAKQYANTNRFAIDKFEEIIKEEKIKCDFQRKDFYLFTKENENYKNLREEFFALRKLFVPVSFVEKIDLPIKIRAAIRYENQAQFHPLKYIYALANKINGDGSYIFENTRALDIEESKNKCKVMTDKGDIRGKYVVVATHFPFYDPSFYFARMYPSRSYALGIKIKNKFPDGMFMSIEENGLTYRNYVDKKREIVIIGGEDHKIGSGNEKEHYKKLEKNIKNELPFKKIKYYWSTHDNVTIDRVPYIGKISSKSNNIFVATGFGKWGMTTSMVSGLIISDIIENGESQWQDIFSPLRFKPIVSAKTFLKQNLNVAERYFRGKVLSGEKKLLSMGEGVVVEKNGEKVAAYKNENGDLTFLEPYCPHMGCILNWNSAEKSWDCPCHGSRFTPDGKMINGPAIKNMKEKQLDNFKI